MVGPAQADQEIATSADGFVDSIGIGTHITDTGSDYAPGANYNTLQSMLIALGVRHIRADMHVQIANVFPSRIDTIYTDYGISSDMVGQRIATDISMPSQISLALNHPSIESMEGMNEPDAGSHAPYSYTALNGTTYTDVPPYSYPATQAMQNDIYTQIAGAKPVLSPAASDPVLERFILPFNCDIESMHSYPQGRMPTGFGLDSDFIPGIDVLSTGATLLPLYATETGYQTSTLNSPPYSSQLAQAKYTLRTLGEYYLRGVARTYLYDLVNDGTDLTNPEDNWGLINYNLTPKPVYTCEQNLISILKEKSWNTTSLVWGGQADANFAPGSLDYTLVGAPEQVHHILLQKTNGAFYLLLWQEIPSYDTGVTPPVDITNPTVPVTLQVNTPIKEIDVYDPSSSTTPTNTYTYPSTLNQPGSVTLNVADQVMIVQLTPAATGSPWAQTDIGSPAAGSGAPAGGFFGEGLAGSYFQTYSSSGPQGFANEVMQRVDPSINFSWGHTPPITTTGTTFGVRWTGQVVPVVTGAYTFTTQCDSGVVLTVNGTAVINRWYSGGPGGVLTSSTVSLTAGQAYDIEFDTWHSTTWCTAGLQWSCPSLNGGALTTLVPSNGWNVAGAGSDIWGTSDQLHYLYQPVTGNVTVTARVASIANLYNNNTKAGVMIRQDLTAGAANACVVATNTAGINFQYRIAAGGITADATVSGVVPPYWVRLVRSGSNFSGYTSPDGVTWTQLGSAVTISMTGTVYVGLPVCSRYSNPVVPAQFDNISITYPTVSIQATTPLASRSPATNGVFTVTRTGGTTAALPVSYTVGGTGVAGTDYTTLPGSVTIPIGSSTATVNVVPITTGKYPANVTVQATLSANTAYNIGGPASDTVQIPSGNILANFESGSLTGWTAQAQSAISVVTSPVDPLYGGTHAMKWIFTDIGIPYTNEVNYRFSSAQDWTKAKTLTIRIAADAGDPASDITQPLCVDLLTPSGRFTGGTVDTMVFDGTTNWRTLTIHLDNVNLTRLVRNQITGIKLYVNGYQFSGTAAAPVQHVWYLDNIMTQ